MANKRSRKKRSDEWDRCPLCGRPLPSDKNRQIMGPTGRAVCAQCLENFQSPSLTSTPKPDKSPCCSIPSPTQILAALDQTIIGQETAKKAVVMALWKQFLRAQGEDIPKSGLLLYGPTGCGKTALVQEAARLMDLPFLSFDATSISETGYRGRDAAEMVKDLAHRFGSYKARCGVIFVDEIDKIAAREGNENRTAYCRGTQYSLLKLIEGMDVDADGEVVSSADILFLFGGAFSDLTRQKPPTQKATPIGFERDEHTSVKETADDLEPEDFVSYGLEAEFIGRVGRCIRLNALTENHLRKLLLESELSVFRSYQSFFRRTGRKLTMEQDVIDKLVKKALERGMGARGLNALVEEWIQPKLAELAEDCYKHAKEP